MNTPGPDLDLVPKPSAVRVKGGVLRLSGPPAAESGPFAAECGVFEEQIRGCFHGGVLSPQGTNAEGGARLRCVHDGALAEEAYRLNIEDGLVTVAASSGSGAYHGLQTLRQLILSGEEKRLRSGGDVAEIPRAEIEDAPRFPWRGFMLDCSRHFFSAAFIRKIIDALSLHHINRFHWHLTDDQGWRFPVPGYPLLAETGSRRKDLRSGRSEGGFYTVQEIRDIVRFASLRHVEIVPEADLPGHTLSVLASYPALGCTGGPYEVEDRFGIFEDVLCAGNDGIFDFAAAVFGALADLFPSRRVHIGGDEVLFNRWEACPKCRKRLAETGLSSPRELQSWITSRLAAMLAERGKIPIGWDEILEDSPRFPLPEEAVIMSWRGREGGLEAARRGRRVIMSPNTEGCYLDYKHSEDPGEPGQLGISSLKAIYGMNPAGGMDGKEADLILGGQGNLWTELVYAGRIAEYMIFPRISALAEALWNPGGPAGFEDFTRRLSAHRARLDALDLLYYRGT
ncbi:MAG: beta-N-acetylhexosaminidase [Treponema sp.]|jgi:hexosaminidase|nr:beta-N-acetylhexosaminidase [Treponema sp.]